MTWKIQWALVSSVAQVVVCSQTFILRCLTKRMGFLLKFSPASAIWDEPSSLRCHLLAKTGFKKKKNPSKFSPYQNIKKFQFSPWLKDLCAWLTTPSIPDKQVYLGHTRDRTERQSHSCCLRLNNSTGNLKLHSASECSSPHSVFYFPCTEIYIFLVLYVSWLWI